MKIFYSEAHRQHNPPFELFEGGVRMPYLENPDRMDRILSIMTTLDWAELTQAEDFELDPILELNGDVEQGVEQRIGQVVWL